jgi:hypothetical protein
LTVSAGTVVTRTPTTRTTTRSWPSTPAPASDP